MSGVFPEGVTGMEPRIVGPSRNPREVLDWMVCDACDQEVHVHFTVTFDFEWYGEWVCPECGHTNPHHEDDAEDPDREIGGF